MYASQTICSKPNKQNQKQRCLFASNTFSFKNLGTNTVQWLKTMLASPVAALRTCVILRWKSSFKPHYARKYKRKQRDCLISACFITS